MNKEVLKLFDEPPIKLRSGKDKYHIEIKEGILVIYKNGEIQENHLFEIEEKPKLVSNEVWAAYVAAQDKFWENPF